MLTEENVAKGFEAAGNRISLIETVTEESKKLIDQLYEQLKFYTRGRTSGMLGGEDHPGFWPSEGMAKEFGDMLLGIAKKDMSSGTLSGGGGLVPDELARHIIQKLGKYGKFRKNALPVKLGSGEQKVPKIITDLTIYVPGEGTEIPKSDMAINTVGILPKKFACLTAFSSELEEDTIVGLAEIIGVSITRSMAKAEDLVGFLGDGTSTYYGMQGIVGALRAVDETIGNIQSLQVASGNAYSEITLADLRKVVGRLPEEAEDDAQWYMSRKFYYNTIYPLAETAGNASIFEILSDKKTKYLLGYPVEFVSCMPSVEADSQICALLGDLSIGAYMAERRELRLDRSDQAYFAEDQVGIRATERVDCVVYGVGDTDEAGPIVGLITAAS